MRVQYGSLGNSIRDVNSSYTTDRRTTSFKEETVKTREKNEDVEETKQ